MAERRTVPTSCALDSVPSWVAHVFLTGIDADVRAQLEHCGVRVGARVELDLTAAKAVLGAAVVDGLRAYDARCRDFFDAYSAGQDPGAYVMVRRPLVSVRQQDTKKARVDLSAHLEACAQVPLLDEVAELVTAADVDWDGVLRLGAAARIDIRSAGNESTVRLSLPAGAFWPEIIGGAASRGEVARHVTLVVNHAAWRDRRNRRLVCFEAVAEEVWPDPSPLREACGLPPL